MNNQRGVVELKLRSIEYRKQLLTIIKEAGAGHTGGSLSCVDILNVLYNQVMNVSPETIHSPLRDRYIHSKGHSVEALYTVLADKGFFPREELRTLNRSGSHFVGHPTRKVPGIEHNTGALGHGFSVAVGMALAGKLDSLPYRVFVTLGDGELTEGSNWEAAMSASNYGLDNLTAIIDRNTLQITGRTEEVMRLEPLGERFASFGFVVRTCDGNDVEALLALLSSAPWEKGKPGMLIASTVKGKGVSFMEDTVKWHHHVPDEAEYRRAIQELDQRAHSLRTLLPEEQGGVNAHS